MQVLRLLLANIVHWSSAYRLDGFRFDAGSSILYSHGGTGTAPNVPPRANERTAANEPDARQATTKDTSEVSVYDNYFGPHAAVDEAGLVYLQLASHLAKTEVTPPLLTVIEEVRVRRGRALAEGGSALDPSPCPLLSTRGL